MRYTLKCGLSSGVIVLSALGSAHAGSTPDHGAAVPGGPANAIVEIDNPAFTVVRIKLAPHEKTALHDVTPRVVVWLTDADIRDTFADGHSDEVRRTAGAVDWVPAARHAGENLGDANVEFLAIVPKPR
jgi:hypothetical protein